MKNVGNEYPWQGMLIITILGIAGVLILFFSGIFSITSYEEFCYYVCKMGMEAIISIFFIVVCLYVWFLFFTEKMLPAKRETLYLLETEKEICKFINKKGKNFFLQNDGDYKVGNYYSVLKTHRTIKKVLKISSETFDIPKEKRSYWLNFYSPMGDFENVFLLPIVYVILLPGLLSMFISEGFEKIFGLIWIIVPTYIISYDLACKINLKKFGDARPEQEITSISKVTEGSKIKETIKKELETMDDIVIGLKTMILACVLVILTYSLKISANLLTRLVILPFYLCCFSLFCAGIFTVIKNEKLANFFKKLVSLIFFISWIIVCFIATLFSIETKQNFSLILVLVPFWAVGIFGLYNAFNNMSK